MKKPLRKERPRHDPAPVQGRRNNTMNMGDKTRTVTVRLTEEQYEFLNRTAKAIEVTPSRFLRMVVNASMAGSALGAAAAAGMEATNLEHRQTDSDHIVEQ